MNVGGSYEIYDQLEGITPPGKSSLRATVRIVHDDTDGRLAVGADRVFVEGDGTSFFAVTLTQPSRKEVTVNWLTEDGNAVAGQDYVAGNGTLTFAVGEVAKTITVELIDDEVAEPIENFGVTLREARNAEILVFLGFGTIIDDDEPPVTIAARTASVVEGDDAVFVLTRGGDVSAALAAAVGIRPYAPAAPERTETASFRAGSRTAEVTVPTADDGVVDTEERVIRATVAAGDGYAVGDPASASVAVTDNDAVRELRLDRSISPTFVAAGNELSFGYTVRNLGNVASGAPLTIVDDVAGELTCSTEPLDPRAGDEVDRALCTATYVVTAADVATGRIVSTAYATDGVTRSPEARVVVVRQDQAVLSICNGDLHAGAVCDPTWEVAEDAGSVTLTVYLSHALESEVRVPWATVAATATAGADFAAGEGTLTFAAGDRSRTVVVTITDDLLDESRETFHVDLGTPHNAVLGVDRATVAISDDDERPAIAVEGPVPAEPVEGTDPHVEFSLTLGKRAGRRVEVSYATADGAAADAADPWPPALDGTDYARTAGRLTFEPGETRKTVRIPILSDAVHEDREEFRFTVGDPHGADLDASDASHRVVIRDDDDASEHIVLTVSPSRLPEGGGDVALTVTGTFDERAQQDPVTVDLAIAGGTATAGTDFTAPAPFQLTIAGAATSGTTTVILSVTGDDLDEDDETLVLTGTADGFTIGPDGGRTITIADDDTRGLALSETALAIDEGASAGYTVALASQPTAEVTVAVSAGAGAGVTVAPASLTFSTADWSAAQTVTVTAPQDADGADEAAVVAHDATGGDYGDESAQVTVRVADDETPSTAVALTARPAAVAEDGGEREVTVTATLDAAPRKSETAVAVTVQPEAAAPGAAADWAPVDGFTITIAVGQTSAAATFTLAPVDDDVDEVDERVALRAATGVEALPAADAFVTVTDDDQRGVTVAPTALAIAEGDDADYAVALTSAPTGPVLVLVTAPADVDLRADPRLLEFTAADWSTAQTVTVHALADADAAADAPATLSHAVSGGDYDGQDAAGVTVTIEEADSLAIALAAASAAEPARAVTFTVTLTAVATAPVSVAYATADGSARAGADYTQSGGTLTFAPGDRSRLIRVPVTDDALDEADAETFTLTLSGAAGAPLADGAATLVVTGTIEDDDVRGITVAPTALPLAEDAAGSYAVTLASQPSADVTVTPTVAGDGDVTVAPAALTFTAADWRQAQRVTVTAADDTDAVDDAATVTHVVRGGDYEAHGVAAAPVTVTVDDDDSASTAVALSVEPAALAEAAAATAVTVTAALDAAARTAATAVTVTVGSGTATAGADFAAVDAFTVTIPAGAYRATGSFRLAPVGDAVDEGDETVAVSGSTDAAGLDVTGAALTIEDDDARGMTVSAHELDLDEGDERTYTVVLTSQPSEDVTVDLTVADDRVQGGDADRSAPLRGGAAVTVRPAALSFTAATWQTPQTVTVRGTADADAADDRARILNRARGGDYDRVPDDVVTVTVRDDDTAALTVPAALTVAEGRSASYRVALATRPTAPVTVTIDGAAGTDLTVSPAALTFAVATWDRAQEVTVSAAADADAAADTATLGHAAEGGGYDGVTARVAVTVTDTTPTLRIAGAAAAESAGPLRFEVLLSAPASGAVTVGYATADGSAEAGADYTAAAADAALTIEAGARSAVIAVPVVDDAVDEAAAETFTVTLRDPVDAALADGGQAATGTITDDDARGVTVSETVLQLDEGSSGSYTVVLRSRPTEDVTVTVAGAAGDVSVAAASRTLRFAAGAWNTAQTVTVRAAEDDDALADAAVRLTHTVSGGDYRGVAAAPVTVRVFENDAPVLALAGVSAAEDAGALVLAVTLSTPSSREVTVAYRTADGSGAAGAVAGEDYQERTGTLAFPAGSSAAREIRVPLLDDALAEGDETFTVTLHDAAHATLDGGGATLAATATIVDDDGRGVTVAPTSLEIPEGDRATYTVALRSQPTDAVTVTVAGWQDAVNVPAASRTLNFTTASWDTAQTVTVETKGDEDAQADALVTLTHTVSGGDYGGVAAEPVKVRIIEDDTPVLAIAGARAAEDAGELVFAVTLSVAGSEQVTVDYDTADGSGDAGAKAGHDYRAVNGTLTFAAGTTAAQEIRVPITDDAVDEAAEETFTVTLSNAQEADLAGGGGDLAATGTILDDDARGVTVSPTALAIDEGASGSYTVVLTSQPTGAVTVRATIAGDTDGSLSPAALTFRAADWSTAQTVTVRAAEDDDALADELRVTHAVTRADYDGVPAAAVAVRIVENDRPELALAAARAVEDAGELVFTVTPSLASSERVTVDYATADGSGAAGAQAGQDYQAVSGTLIFPAGAAAAQEIRVPVTDDDADEEEEETFTLTLSGALQATLDGGGATLAATGTIVDDDDPAVTVAFASERVTATEGGAAAIVRVALSADPERTVAVPLTRAPGAGVADGDYAGVPASVTFGAGETAVSFTVSATDDAVDEDDERVVLGFGTPLPAGVTPGSPSGVTVTLADDDDRGVRVSPTALAIDEGAGGSYAVALTSQPTEDVKVTAALPPAAAVSLDPTALTFTAGDWRTAQTVMVTAAADDDAVVPAAVTIRHTVTGGDYDGADAAAVTVRIAETDTPTLALVADARAVESAGSLTFTVRMSVASSDTVTVAWSTAAGTAWAGSDYTQRSGNLTFRPGEPLSRTISVPIADDRVDEQDETFTLTLSGALQATLDGGGATLAATGTIVDDDTRGVALSADALAFLEGDRGSYTVALTSQPTEAVTVAPAAAAGSDADVTFAPASLRFTTVDWATAQTVTVDARQDRDAVNDEATITHGLTGGDYAGLDVASVAVTVLDDETASTAVALAVAPASVAEDVGTAGLDVTVTATLNAAPRTEATAVTVAVAPGTALAADFAAVPDVPFTIAAGAVTASATFTLKPVDDEVDEDDETVTVSGTTTSGLTVNPAAGLTLTITDDDQRGVTVSETELEIDEGASGSYTVVLTSQPTADVTVAVTVPPYAGLAAAPVSLTFTADDWDTAQAVTVTADADDDAIAPAPATLRHAVTGADYGAVRAAPVKVTIVETTVPALAIAGGRAAESAGEVVFTVTLSTADSQAVIVDYASADGTATDGQDYTAVRGSLTFPATDAAPRKIAVPLLDDAADEEEEETFTVTLTAPVDADTPLRAALTDATATARGTIADDDDPAVTAAFAAASYAAAEGGAAAAVTVRLSADPERTLVLPLTVAHHGGASTDDYAGLPPGRTVRFAAGVQEAAFTITATDDALDDDGESLVLGFGELPDGVTAGAVPAATVTLTDDDATPAVAGATAFAGGGGGDRGDHAGRHRRRPRRRHAGLVAGGRRRRQRALHADRRRRAGVHRRQGLREPGRRRRRPRVRADRAGERRRQRGHRRPDRDPHRRGARGEHRGGGGGGRGGRAGAVHGDPRGRPVRGAGGGAGGDRRRRRAGGHRDGRRAHGGVRRRRGERAARRGHRRRRPGRGRRRGHRDPAGRRRLPARDAGRGHGDRRRRRPAAGAEHRRRRRRRGGCAAGVHGQPRQRGGAGARQRAAGDRGLGHLRRQRRGRRRLHRGGRRHADLRRRADRRHHRGVAAGRRAGRGR